MTALWTTPLPSRLILSGAAAGRPHGSMQAIAMPDYSRRAWLRAPNKKRFWDAVVVDGVYGETFGQ